MEEENQDMLKVLRSVLPRIRALRDRGAHREDDEEPEEEIDGCCCLHLRGRLLEVGR